MHHPEEVLPPSLFDKLAKHYSVLELQHITSAVGALADGRPALALRYLARLLSQRESQARG